MVRAIGVLLLIFVAGCQSETPGKMERFMSAQEVDAKDDRACRRYGIKPGTELYIQCRMKQDEMRQNRRNAMISGGNRSSVCNMVGQTLICS